MSTGPQIMNASKQPECNRLCPRGHTMKKRTVKEATCDICYCTMAVGTRMLICPDCHGFAVCNNCTEKSDQPNPYTTSTEYYFTGMTYFDRGEYKTAIENFKISLKMRESLMAQNRLGAPLCAYSAEMLAKSQYWAGETDNALDNCAKVISYYKRSGIYFHEDLVLAQELSKGIKHLQEEEGAKSTRDITLNNTQDLEVLGVSVHYLKTTFMAKVSIANLGRDSTIHEIENLKGPPGVIRRHGANVFCPIDRRMGSSYVHCLSGSDNVGNATHMLSYSWSYKIGDIVDALCDYCETHKQNPKRTYVWIDCFCINQHRVVEQKETGGTGMLDFEQKFPATLKTIGHMLAMFAPWQAPVYLDRIWCIFELYTAYANGCKVDIVMSSKEKHSLEQDVVKAGGCIQKLYVALGNISIQSAQASIESDRLAILKTIESTVGFGVLNNSVKELLRGWMIDVLVQFAETQQPNNGDDHAAFCNRIATILMENGEHNSGLRQFHKCLSNKESDLIISTTSNKIGSLFQKKDDYECALVIATTYNKIGSLLQKKGNHEGALENFLKSLEYCQVTVLCKDHPIIASTHANIGSVLEDKGDYDGALEHYRKCLAIREAVLGKVHPLTATMHNNIGSVLGRKGFYDAALEQYAKGLAIRKTVLGRHPATAKIHWNIGSTLKAKGNFWGAIKQYKKSLAINESILGEGHSDTKSCRAMIDELIVNLYL